MKIGKISESVCKRSVLKYVKKNHEKILRGAALQDDCALFSCQTVSFPVTETLLIRRAIFAVVNDLAVKGVRASKISFSITLPERVRENKLSLMMEEAQSICDGLGILIVAGHTMVTDGVSDIVVTATAEGKKNTLFQEKNYTKKEYIGWDIVCVGAIAMDATAMLVQARENELLKRFPKTMIQKAFAMEETLCAQEHVREISNIAPAKILAVREGGIFASLWDLAKETECGLSIELKKIPMKQTVVEISNYYDLNPYEMISTGCLLLATPDGELLANALYEKGLLAEVIGKLNETNDKLILNEDEVRYIDLPKPDQIRKQLSHEKQMAYLMQQTNQKEE